MKALPLEPAEEIAFATAALALRFGERGVEKTGGHRPAPVTAEQLNEARHIEDVGHNLWTTFQRVQARAYALHINAPRTEVQENVLRGAAGQDGAGSPHADPAVAAIDRGVSLNRALWMLAEEVLESISTSASVPRWSPSG